MNSINEHQQSERGILLQKAADGAHAAAYLIEGWRMSISVALMLAALVATAVHAVAAPIALTGAAWSFVSVLLLSSISQRHTTVAATAQHEFDTWLFGIPWSSYAGERIPDEELRRWARKSKIAEHRLKTWYPEVSGLPVPYAVLSCQRESLTWDWRLRRRFAIVLVVSASAWAALGISIGLIADLSVRTLALRWFLPSSSALIMALQMANGHSQIATAKDKLAAIVRSELGRAGSPGPSTAEQAELMTVAAQVQEGLFKLRQKRERVPRRIYEMYRDRDEADMRATTADLRERFDL